MVKGCQKRTIYVKDTGSRFYEEAYFVLRPGVAEGCAEHDMIKEALRIAGESLSSCSEKIRRTTGKRTLASFAAGLAVGAAVSAIILAIVL